MCAGNYLCDELILLSAAVCVKIREEIVPFGLTFHFQGLPNRYGGKGLVKLKLNNWFSL